MKIEDQDREFRIRPPKPRHSRSDDASALKQVLRIARMSRASRRRPKHAASSPSFGQHEFKQRCAVRVSYTPNKTAGQWKAHGRYLERESAIPDDTSGFGFGSNAEPVAISRVLNQWQKSGDERLFKVILSPEFGEWLDLKVLTREVMVKMEMDLGTRLEWAGVIHDNTEFPHVHVVLRGVRDDGRSLRLDRAYIQHGIRANAQDAATAQLGYRTSLDAQEAERREVHQMRYTSLDRLLRGASASQEQDSGSAIHFEVDLTKQRDTVRQHNLRARLILLRTMGLSEAITPHRWAIRSDFETVLRAIQRAADRQRTLAAHHSLLSDSRLQSCLTDVSKIEDLEGRVLGHSEDQANGKAYMMLEGTDHSVHFIYHSPEIEHCRRTGELRPNSFVRIVRQKDRLLVQDFGDADRLLGNKEYFQEKALALIRRGILCDESSVDGWLGKYETALQQAITEVKNGEPRLDNREIPRQRSR